MAYLRAFFSLFPAHAGVILRGGGGVGLPLAFPRTRGGDPTPADVYVTNRDFSPHTRG